MEKKLILVVCLVAVLLVSAFGISALLGVGRPQGEEYKTLAEQLLSDARQEFQKIRGVTVREVNLEVVNQSWVAETWGAPSNSERETILRNEKVYKALFLISQNVSLYDTRLEWTTSFRAAKWNGNLYVVEENFDVTNKFSSKSTFVHELTHFMQENHSLLPMSTFDGSKALTALKEGDATFMADTFKNDGVIPAAVDPTSYNDQTDLPATINRINRFPYRYGVEFVKVLYASGGWDAIEDAYANPPGTTEQIMHPEKYFANEDAKTVKTVSVTGNWTLTDTDSLGEYFVFVMLDNWVSEEDAEDAAAGWGSDVFSYFESGDGFLFTWNIVWDTENDAHEFDLAFQDMMYKSIGDEHNCRTWSANGQYISIRTNGNSTLIVSSADKAMVQQPLG